MKKVSGLVCNDKAFVETLIKDDCHLFKDKDVKSLFDILKEGSEEKLSDFLQTISDEKASVDWEICVIKDGEVETLFFSGLYWMDKFFIQISSERSDLVFYPKNIKLLDDNAEISGDDEDEAFNKKLNDISRLNNELVNIQRELTQKNRQLEQLNERLEILATTDSLTGIYNRRAIFNRAEDELERASREGQNFNLAILDLDCFKGINDTYGHQAGDSALRLVAECLKQSTRNYDGSGRIGGDEFMFYFSLDSENQFKDILERIITRITNASIEVEKGGPLKLNASIGGVYVEPKEAPKTNIEALLAQADKLLYQAKNNDGQSIVVGEMTKIGD